ncbi:MAG: ABC transporter ATP-binding protein [Oscillospiraceae bacterium]|nr:ABC transporter ATP-binding protein [Oscillospiraceae bacterium]
MSQEDAIVIKDVQKKFRVFYDKGQSFKEILLFKNRSHYEERTVLNGISLTVKKGEAIGLVGHNGCGKSTLLKLMTRILYPDNGSISINGRVSSLIELGAGFHPDMSGRENIYTNAAIFGLTKKEIDKRLNDIISFSELEEFIDNPVRTYSSGMYMRLAFSVAINVDADVLLIDEILAVGDANFQAKCFNRLQEIKASGTTIVIVSHALAQIEQICDRTVWINDGKICAEGAPRDIHPVYLEFMGKNMRDTESANLIASNNTRWGNQNIKIKEVKVLDDDGNDGKAIATGSRVTFTIDYEMVKKTENVVFGIAIYRVDGIHCYGVNTMIDGLPAITVDSDGSYSITIDKLQLLPGEYILDVSIENTDAVPVDYYKNARRFVTFSPVSDAGCFRLEHTWKIN